MDPKLERLCRLPSWEWPVDAAQRLLGLLRDARAPLADRRKAAELASEVSVLTEELVGALLQVLDGPGEPPPLREQAAISLGPLLEYAQDTGEFEDPEDRICSLELVERVRRTLARLYRDPGEPKDLRRKALEASVRGMQPWHEAAVRAAYYSGDPAWRQTSVFCMRYVEGFAQEILETLESGPPLLVYHAVIAAGVWSLDDAWPHIEMILKSEKDPGLLLAAIEACTEMDAPEDEVADALSALEHARSSDVAEAAADALLQLGLLDPDALEELDEGDFDDRW